MNVRFATILAWQGTVHIKAITVIPVNLVRHESPSTVCKITFTFFAPTALLMSMIAWTLVAVTK